MANRWGKMRLVTDFIFLDPKITVDSDCSHEIKRHLLLGRKAVTSLAGILKSRDITLPTEVHILKAVVFPGVMYERESWTIKKAESQSTDAFERWCWRRFLRVPWTATRPKQSILKEINLDYSLERLMLNSKLQYFGHMMWVADSWKRPWCWERLKAGEEGRRGSYGWMASSTQWTWVWANSRRWWRTEEPSVLPSMGLQRVRHNRATEQRWQQEKKNIPQPREN